jgi:hypothetical protein
MNTRMGMGDFLKSNFDKLLVYSIILFFVLMALHAVHHGGGDTPFMTLCVDETKNFSGSLLTLVAGRLLAGRASANGNGQQPPAPPPDQPAKTEPPKVAP